MDRAIVGDEKYNVMLHNIRKFQLEILEIVDYFDEFCKKYNIKYYISSGTLLGAVRHKGFIPWDDDFDVMMPHKDYYAFISKMKEEIDGDNYFLQEENSRYSSFYYTKLRKNNTTFIEKFIYKRSWKNIHRGIYIDIFCLHNGATTKLGRSIQYFLSKVIIAHSHFKRGFTHFPLIKKIFIIVSVPLLPFESYFFSQIKKYNYRETGFFAEIFTGNKFYNAFIPNDVFSETIMMDFEERSLPAPGNYDKYLKIMYGDYLRFPSRDQQIKQMHSTQLDMVQ